MKSLYFKGYTILEIMVAIIILGVMTGLAVPRFTSTMELFRSKEGVQALNALLQAQMSSNVDVEEARIANYSLATLDVTIPTLDYFNTPVLDCDGTNCPGTVNISGSRPVYAHVERSSSAYTLYIQPDGTILCTPQVICERMHYQPW